MCWAWACGYPEEECESTASDTAESTLWTMNTPIDIINIRGPSSILESHRTHIFDG